MNKKIGNIFKGDKVIWMVFFFLCLISVVEVFSASSSLTYKNESYWGPALYHGRILILGVIVMIFVVNIPCKFQDCHAILVGFFYHYIVLGACGRDCD